MKTMKEKHKQKLSRFLHWYHQIGFLFQLWKKHIIGFKPPAFFQIRSYILNKFNSIFHFGQHSIEPNITNNWIIVTIRLNHFKCPINNQPKKKNTWLFYPFFSNLFIQFWLRNCECECWIVSYAMFLNVWQKQKSPINDIQLTYWNLNHNH